MNTHDSPQNMIKIKPTGNRNKTIHKLLFSPILDTLRKIKTSIPIRRNSRVHGNSSVSNKPNPLLNKGGKNGKRSTIKNRKSKRNQ
jgi:hypothetical protein